MVTITALPFHVLLIYTDCSPDQQPPCRFSSTKDLSPISNISHLASNGSPLVTGQRASHRQEKGKKMSFPRSWDCKQYLVQGKTYSTQRCGHWEFSVRASRLWRCQKTWQPFACSAHSCSSDMQITILCILRVFYSFDFQKNLISKNFPNYN